MHLISMILHMQEDLFVAKGLSCCLLPLPHVRERRSDRPATCNRHFSLYMQDLCKEPVGTRFIREMPFHFICFTPLQVYSGLCSPWSHDPCNCHPCRRNKEESGTGLQIAVSDISRQCIQIVQKYILYIST